MGEDIEHELDSIDYDRLAWWLPGTWLTQEHNNLFLEIVQFAVKHLARVLSRGALVRLHQAVRISLNNYLPMLRKQA